MKNLSSEEMQRKARIRYGLARAGRSQRAIAETLGVGESLVSQVIAGRRHNADVQRAIAEVVGLPPEELFPPREALAA